MFAPRALDNNKIKNYVSLFCDNALAIALLNLVSRMCISRDPSIQNLLTDGFVHKSFAASCIATSHTPNITQ